MLCVYSKSGRALVVCHNKTGRPCFWRQKEISGIMQQNTSRHTNHLSPGQAFFVVQCVLPAIFIIAGVVKWNVALIVVGAAIFCVLPVGFCTLITHEHCIKPVKMWVRRRSQRASKKAPKEHPQRPSHATMEGNSSEGCEYQAEKPCSVVAPSCPPCPPPAYESTVNLNDKV